MGTVFTFVYIVTDFDGVCVCSLRAWQKLKEVLQSWLQTSGQDEQMEKDSVCQELEEVGGRLCHCFL